jgi:hypothetical protein
MGETEPDRPAFKINEKMIDAATAVLNNSGAFDYEPLIGSNRTLVAEMLEAAILAAGYSPRIPKEFRGT